MSTIYKLFRPKNFDVLHFVFIIEILERFSYYGMHSIVAMFAIKKLHISTDTMHSVLNTFTIFLFLSIFVGGYISDRYIGCKKSILLGSILLLSGYLMLTLSTNQALYLALGLILSGNMFFKAAPPALLGRTVLTKDESIDSVFTLYYMAVNIGSFLGMILFPIIIISYGFIVAFWICGFVISLSILLLSISYRKLPKNNPICDGTFSFLKACLLAIIATVIVYFALQPSHVNHIFLYGIYVTLSIGACLLFIRYFKQQDNLSKRKIIVALILIVEALIYFIPNWHTSLTIAFFANNFASNSIFGFEIEKVFFQSLNPLWIIMLSPLLAYMYRKQFQAGKIENIVFKFAIGTLLCAVGYLLLPLASLFPTDEGLVSANWIVLAYLCLALGELLVSGLGLAMITKLTPPNHLGFMMGIWFCVTPLAIFIGGQLPYIPSDVKAHLNTSYALNFFSSNFLILGIAMLFFGIFMVALSERLFSLTTLNKSSQYLKLKITHLTDSLSYKVSKKVSNYLVIITLISCLIIFILNNLISQEMYNNRVNNWVTRFISNINSVNSAQDIRAINIQMRKMEESHLFSNFILLDKNHHLLSSFGYEPHELSRKIQYLDQKESIGYSFKPLYSSTKNIIGYYSYRTDYNHYFIPFLWVIVVSLISILFLYFLFSLILEKTLKTEFDKFGSFITKIEKLSIAINHSKAIAENNPSPNPMYSEEEKKINTIFSTLIQEIKSSHEKLKSITKRAEHEKQQKKLNQVASRVAHDLSSYIVGLNHCVKRAKNITLEDRETMQTFIHDIKAMSDDLLNKYKTKNSTEQTFIPHSIVNQTLKVVHIAEIKSQIHGIDIKTTMKPNCYASFVLIDKSEFKRLMLNLIANAIESDPTSRQVHIDISTINNCILIEVKDDGKGIPPKILNQLGKQELSFGKKNGHGLGVYHANKMIESWGGTFSITSGVDSGTLVTIHIPCCPTPAWYLEKIDLSDINTVIILDDNQEIHKLWASKMPSSRCSIVNLYSPDDAQEWNKNHKILSHQLFLVDYQYAMSETTGLDIITQLNIESQSILVTGRSDEENIIEQCITHSIKILPKNNIAMIEIID